MEQFKTIEDHLGPFDTIWYIWNILQLFVPIVHQFATIWDHLTESWEKVKIEWDEDR